MEIAKNIKYIGVNDHAIDLFEGQYLVKNGMSYNSYLILDEKTAVMDTVDAHFTGEWLKNIENILGDREPDFLIVQHMEPDHSASICEFMEKYKHTKLVAGTKAFAMLKQFFCTDYKDRKIAVKEKDVITLGSYSLQFVEAPMVHWPEVIMTYEKETGTLFSADAFGKFGTLDVEEEWIDEARRYYIGVVGKYGVQVRKLLEKVEKLDVKTICPLHGPTLKENLSYYLNLYKIWSGYEVEQEGVLIAYSSIYENTKKAVKQLAELLQKNGCNKIVMKDLTRCDMAEAVSDAFCYGKIVLATTTYNGGIFPCMRQFIEHLTERNYQNRKIALIENGSWAPTAAKTMKHMFDGMKHITFCETVVTIKSALSDESMAQLSLLVKELGEN